MWIARDCSKEVESKIPYLKKVWLYNRRPELITTKRIVFTGPEYKNEEWIDLEHWSSCHGKIEIDLNKFPEFNNILFENPIEVELIIDNEDPMFYIQRCNENLFIGKARWHSYSSGKKIYEVDHNYRLRNGLFPEITDKDGVIGVSIKICG